ncbi:MAG: insulinase family protein, partial [Mycobacterium sp.]|nr:insulinase family protein [Mycobacterium sp.]
MPRPPIAKPPGLRGRPSGASAAELSTMHRTVLPGGLRVVTEYVPSVRSASVGVWVNVGSRD